VTVSGWRLNACAIFEVLGAAAVDRTSTCPVPREISSAPRLSIVTTSLRRCGARCMLELLARLAVTQDAAAR